MTDSAEQPQRYDGGELLPRGRGLQAFLRLNSDSAVISSFRTNDGARPVEMRWPLGVPDSKIDALGGSGRRSLFDGNASPPAAEGSRRPGPGIR
jgi:hypothetical protein